MSKYLTEQENKTIRLVEERCVAAFPYKTAINKIMSYCEKQCYGMKPGDYKEFPIPRNLTSEIDFVQNLFINVIINDAENAAHSHGGGHVSLRIDDKIVNGKYQYGEIIIYGYSYHGILYERTILNNLYHELNHFYEAWKELMKTNSMSLFAKQTRKAVVDIQIFDNENMNYFIQNIIYRLFSETELNAIIAGVYGDLNGLRSTRDNFSKDVVNTQAYKIYYDTKTFLPILMQYLKQNIDKVPTLFSVLKQHGIVFNPYTKDEIGYLKELNRRIKYLLKCLIRGIGKAASLYYDSIEVPKDNVNLKIK